MLKAWVDSHGQRPDTYFQDWTVPRAGWCPATSWANAAWTAYTSKISKIAATRYQILRLKSTKFNLRLGFTPDPAGGAYSAPQTASLYLRGLLLSGWRGREGIGEGKGIVGTGGGLPLQLGTGSSSEGGEGKEKGKKGAWVSDDQC